MFVRFFESEPIVFIRKFIKNVLLENSIKLSSNYRIIPSSSIFYYFLWDVIYSVVEKYKLLLEQRFKNNYSHSHLLSEPKSLRRYSNLIKFNKRIIKTFLKHLWHFYIVKTRIKFNFYFYLNKSMSFDKVLLVYRLQQDKQLNESHF